RKGLAPAKPGREVHDERLLLHDDRRPHCRVYGLRGWMDCLSDSVSTNQTEAKEGRAMAPKRAGPGWSTSDRGAVFRKKLRMNPRYRTGIRRRGPGTILSTFGILLWVIAA